MVTTCYWKYKVQSPCSGLLKENVTQSNVVAELCPFNARYMNSLLVVNFLSTGLLLIHAHIMRHYSEVT